jgi:hypothetical protein
VCPLGPGNPARPLGQENSARASGHRNPSRLLGPREVHSSEGGFVAPVRTAPEAYRRRCPTQRAAREPQRPGGVPGVQQDQRPGTVAVVRDRALRGGGQFDGRPGRRAVGLRAEAVHTVAQWVVSVTPGGQ